MLKSVLAEREYKIEGGWYAPREKLQSFDSVASVELYNTMSSAGDWGGFFIQKIGKNFYMIPFDQDNNYPRGGFTLYTGKVIASWRGEMMTRDDAIQLYADLMTW